jgi:predicted DNA-binding transcriptional regulator YafY
MKLSLAIDILRALYKNQTKLPISGSSLARKLGVSDRTIYRYVEELIACGIPINVTSGRYGGMKIEGK